MSVKSNVPLYSHSDLLQFIFLTSLVQINLKVYAWVMKDFIENQLMLVDEIEEGEEEEEYDESAMYFDVPLPYRPFI